MQHFYTQTDRDWHAEWKCMMDLRHERMEHEARIVCPREATPLGEEVPKSTMALHRAAKLKEEAERFKRIWGSRTKLEKPVGDDGDDIKF